MEPINWKRAACILSLAGVASGCVMIPLPMSTALPDISAQLPHDLRSSDSEVMLLASYSDVAGPVPTQRLNAPLFVQAKNVSSASETLKLESGTTVIGVVLSVPIPQASTEIKESLNTLCLIAQDGRTFTFAGGERNFTVRHQDTLWRARRDAIISAVHTEGASFHRVDGPCDINATGFWTSEISAKMVQFLSRIPGIDEEPKAASVARLFETSETSIDKARIGMQRVMFLASVRSANRPTEAEAPAFFSKPIADAVIDAIVATKVDDILPFLDSVQSGARSANKLQAERACAISSDGRVVWWSKDANRWVDLGVIPPHTDWKQELLAQLRGPPKSQVWDEGCMPHGLITWSDKERHLVSGFIERLPSQDRSKILATAFSTSGIYSAAADISGANALVLCMPWCFGGEAFHVTPLFVRTNSVSALVGAVKSSTAHDFVKTVGSRLSIDSKQFKEAAGIRIYVISADGQAIQLEKDTSAPWAEKKRITVSSVWRQDAINAVQQEFKNFRGSDVLYLASSTGWPMETRQSVVSFLQKISVSDLEAVKR